jgi:hypothetical protein
MKKADRKVIICYPSPTFGGVRCGSECHMLTQYPWGSKLPPEETSLRCILIRIRWPYVQYGQHCPETCYVLYLQEDVIQREPTRGSLSTISPHTNALRANTRRNFTTCRMGSTRAIMVWHQSVYLNGDRRA